MKKVYAIFCLFFFLVSWSQKPAVYVLRKSSRTLSFASSSIQLNPLSFQLSLQDKKFYLDYYTLSIYNPTTQLNDQYLKVSDTYFLSNNKTFPYYNFNGVKMDSFNPNGVSDFGSAIATGLLNLLFEGR